MQIRRALVDDAGEISMLVLAAKRHWGYSVAQMDAWKPDLEITPATLLSDHSFVAEQDGKLVGFYTLAASADTWELGNLWVLPEFNRRGIGRALLGHAHATAASVGASVIRIDADPNAEGFYLACGARLIGVLAAPIVGEPDRVRPQLELTLTAPKC